jgi:cobalt/nickel transport system permease protein
MARKTTLGWMIGAGLAVALILAFFVSPFASSSPDGLEKVAADKRIDTDVKDHALGDGPLADYSVKGVDNSRLSTGLAGVLGVVLTFALGLGLFMVVRMVRTRAAEGGDRPVVGAAPPV